jgi:hypothetical protein
VRIQDRFGILQPIQDRFGVLSVSPSSVSSSAVVVARAQRKS